MPSGGGTDVDTVEMLDCCGLPSSQNSKSASVKLLSRPVSMSMRPMSPVPHPLPPPPPAIGSTVYESESMPMPTLILTSSRDTSRMPSIDCQDVVSWAQFSKPGNASNEVTGAEAVENATASGEETMVGADDPTGAKDWANVGGTDRGCVVISTEDVGTVFVGGEG